MHLVKFANFVLTLLSLILSVLILVNIYISRENSETSNKLVAAQQVIAEARNNEINLRALTIRIAQGTVKDPALKDLLTKNQLRATIEINGKQQDVP